MREARLGRRVAGFVKTLGLICRTALPLLLGLPAAALAQEAAVPPDAASQADQGEPAVAFSADSLEYDDDSDIVTATGDVLMNREGYFLKADRVTWNRLTGEVVAQVPREDLLRMRDRANYQAGQLIKASA